MESLTIMVDIGGLVDVIFNSMGDFVGSWSPMISPLVVLNTKSIMFSHLWCMPGGDVWIWLKSNLFRFIEGQTHFSILSDQYRMFFCLILHTTLKHTVRRLTKHGRCCGQNNQLWTKRLVELKDDNSIVFLSDAKMNAFTFSVQGVVQQQYIWPDS